MKIFFYIIVFLISSLKFQYTQAQWVYQELPGNYYTSNVKFFNENTGIMILQSSDPGYLRTTNGGNNWVYYGNSIVYYDMQKIDSTALYLIGRYSGIDRIQRTYDRGLTWDSVSLTLNGGYTGISFINRDTGWVTGANNINYNCIWKTTNGGVTLIQQTDTTGMGLIFFLKNKINGQYYGWLFGKYGDNKFWRTTNSGINWFQTTRPSQYCNYFEFLDGNTGWFTGGNNIYKTTNGGSNWTMQTLPVINGIVDVITCFKIINYDTIYGSGGVRLLPGGILHPIVWKTINGGTNWGYQEPDTSIHGGGSTIEFVNGLTGWLYGGNGIHTTNGGGTIIYTDVKNNSNIISKEYILYQNYPNPFNSQTQVEFSIFKNSVVTLKIFDISGKEVIQIYKGESLQKGSYKILMDFSKGNLSSGIYFCRLNIWDNNYLRLFTDTKKMVYVK